MILAAAISWMPRFRKGEKAKAEEAATPAGPARVARAMRFVKAEGPAHAVPARKAARVVRVAGTANPTRHARAAASLPLLALLALLVIGVAAGPTPAAWADEADSPGNPEVDSQHLGNKVDPTQVPDSAFLYDTTIYDLLNATPAMQGRTIQVTGEVIGDRLRAEEDPGMYWITLASLDPSKEGSISVLVDEKIADSIDTYGRYGVMGTKLKVLGVFHLACDTHEGITDVHATSATVVDEGYARPDAFRVRDFVPGAVACVIGVGLMLLFRFLRERER